MRVAAPVCFPQWKKLVGTKHATKQSKESKTSCVIEGVGLLKENRHGGNGKCHRKFLKK
jgi:hypothetical protein